MYYGWQGDQGATFNFPVSFVNFAEMLGGDGGPGCNTVSIGHSNSAFTIWGKNPAGGYADTGAQWLAIGK